MAAAHDLTDKVAFRYLTVCLPAGTADGDPFTVAAHLAGHLPRTQASLCPRFLAKPSLRSRGLIGMVRCQKRRYCAGGPLRMVDLDATRHGAMYNAAIGYTVFTRVVAGTKPATPWPEYVRRHQQKPERFPLQAARRVFCNQPRVAAMTAHSALPGNAHIDPLDLEALQASYQTYLNIQALRAAIGDALLTVHGELLRPNSALLTDQLAFYTKASQALQVMPPQHVIVAVTI